MSGVHATAVLRRRARARVVALVVLVVLLVAGVGANLALGQYSMSLGEVWSALTAGPGVARTSGSSAAGVLWSVRAPRLVLGVLVGAALAVAGTLLQGLFGNPLAEPSVIGVTAGAGVGAAAAIVFGLSFAGTATVPLFAFAAGVVTTLLIYRLARVGGEVRVVTLILTGIAVNAVAGAAISFLVYLAPTASREQIIFWQMGSLNGARWNEVATVAVAVVVGVLGAVALARPLDVLSLGERAAFHAGVNVGVARIAVVGVSTLLAAAAVSFAGVIGFVGLIVPHILRQVTGPSNRWLVPLSALGGAVLVILADLVARILIAYADLPIGIFTALVGGPTFFVLLRRTLLKGGQP
ncbi:FecCD family ABC transporter permease [Corynebacterium bovis]|uniref:FecCD family ABC transporter permease n=8 Tax=Corynebacterium bovis TaxID=36808 RepID=UPI0021AB1D03|nr:iron ABC transporter permease [Corynebacterium bovis]